MKKKKLNRLSLRAWILLGIVIIFGFGSIIVRLFNLQVINGASYKAKALQQGTRSQVLTPQRGSIMDRNGKVLAQSAPVWNVFISPAEIKDEDLADIAKNLSEILEIPEETILKKAENKESYYEKIINKIDSGVRQKIEDYLTSGDERIKGVYLENDIKRYYTYDNLASTLLGFTTEHDNRGAYGLESYYDSILAGTPGVAVSTKNARNLYMHNEDSQYHDAVDGHSIVLTIDETVQSMLEKHLEMAVIEHSVENKVSGIIMNIKTGEILAMATKPDFNPNKPYEVDLDLLEAATEGLTEGSKEYEAKLNELQFDQWRNKAISDPYEPGSVYKIITMSAALEENKSYLQDHFYCPGSIKVADRTINCWLHSGHGDQDFFGIVKNSCNPAFVTLGQRLGGELTYKYMADFGLGKPTGIDLPGEAEGILHTAKQLSDVAIGGKVQLASTSFGQSFKTTPIQLITAVSAAVNGGYLVEPYVVKQVMDAQGNVVETIQPNIKRQVISEETSDEVKQLVENVVADGSGRHAAVPGYRIGGKTGTSEKLDLLPAKKYVLSFVGFAPMEDPTYACLVLLDEPKLSNPWASVIAAPIVGAIFQESLPYLGVEPHYSEAELSVVPVDVPGLIGAKPHDAQATLTGLGLKTKIVGQGSDVLRQVPLGGTKVQKGSLVTIYTEDAVINPNLKTPDLKGKTLDQAKQTLNDMGLNCQVQGINTANVKTAVASQWPDPGEKLETADVVVITMVRADSIGDDEDTFIPETAPPVVTEGDSHYQDNTISEDEVQDTNLGAQDVAPEAPQSSQSGNVLQVREKDPEEQPKDTTNKKPEEKSEPAEPQRGPTGEILDG